MSRFKLLPFLALIVFSSCGGNQTNSTDIAVKDTSLHSPIADSVDTYENSNTSVNTIATSDTVVKPTVPCVIQSNEVTFDSDFNPSSKMTLLNQSSKTITQVIFKFDFSNMGDWDNTTVSRSLASEETAYTNLGVTIAPGETRSGVLKIPLPQRRDKDTPEITIVKVRYDDGTIETL